MHHAHPDRDRVHLVPRPIPRLHDHLAERKKPCGLRNIAMVILHETSFAIGLVTNALLICANLNPQTSNGDLRVAVFASELNQLKLLAAWRICFCGNSLNKPAAWLVNRQICFVRNALPVTIYLLLFVIFCPCSVQNLSRCKSWNQQAYILEKQDRRQARFVDCKSLNDVYEKAQVFWQGRSYI